jgi:DNA polymerase-1
MEMAGILVDIPSLEELGREFDQRLQALEREIFEMAGEKFNLNSPRQLGEILFEKLKLPQQKKTKKKTGYSTDMEVLKKLAEMHPLPARMLLHRNLSKLKSTYVDGLAKAVNSRTGRIHTSYNQTVTATGRLSSSDPNLQNIPVKTDEGKRIRKLFIAPEGRILVSADYSQIDLRVLAHYSEDKALVQAFRHGEDIHSRTAAEIFGVMPGLVTPEMRRAAKTVNFGIVYGMSAFGLAKELGISRKEAAQFMERYFNRYPGVKNYMAEIVQKARKDGFVTTLLGRRRYLPDITARQRNIREFAERTAINTPIQGTAADIIKLAMIKCRQKLLETCPSALMVLQVHDELVIEADIDKIQTVTELLKDVMENILKLKVPLTVSVGWGKNWADIKS